MKKLLSLLTMLIVAISASWAATESISWAITTNQLTITPTITPSTDATLSDASTSISLTGFSQTSSQKDGYCKPFYGTVVDFNANDDYAQISFKVASGYTFTPTSLGMTVFSHGTGNLKYKVIISDNQAVPTTVTSNEIQPSSGGEAAITFAADAFTGKTFEGTVTIKMYAYNYSNTSSGKRTYIKSPITISGTTAAKKTVAAQEYAGVKVGDATLTEGTDFTKAENVVTLSDNYAAIAAPTDVKLINHITYTDSSTEDQDVAVTIGETASEGFFSGTATIGSTTYTVKVPQNVTPTLVANKDAVTVTSAKTATGTATIHLTGANLAGESVSVSLASSVTGLSVSPASVTIAEGAVDADVTVSYQSDDDVAEANVNLVISTDGVDDIVIPVTYSSTAAATSIEVVSTATTWDFSKTALTSTVDIKTASAENDYYLANIAGIETDASKFYAPGMAVRKYNTIDGGRGQGSIVKIKTSVAGNLIITFSNTGGSRAYRYLYVNGAPTEFKSNSTTNVVTTTIYVPAGDIELKGYIQDRNDPQYKSEEEEGDNFLNWKSITFTPLTEVVPATVGATITDCGYATFSSIYPIDLSTLTEGMTAYVASSANTSAVQMTTVSGNVPARTGLIIKGTAGQAFTVSTTTATATAPASNLLVPVLSSTQIANADNTKYSNYVFGWKVVEEPGFFRVNATKPTLTAGKAYLHTPVNATGDALSLDFEQATTVEAVVEANAETTAPLKVIKNGKFYIGNYNVVGQQVK